MTSHVTLSQNNEAAAMLVSTQTNVVESNSFFYVNIFFSSIAS